MLTSFEIGCDVFIFQVRGYVVSLFDRVKPDLFGELADIHSAPRRFRGKLR